MIKKLKRKFVILNLSMVTLILIGILCTIIYTTQQNIKQSEVEMLLRLAHEPQQAALPQSHPPEDLLRAYLLIRTDAAGNILQKNAVHFSMSEQIELQTLLAAVPANEHPLPLHRQTEKMQVKTVTTGVLSAYQIRFVHIENTPLGDTYVFLDISDSQAMLCSLARSCAGVGLFAFALFFCISVWFARWAARPVEAAWNDQKQFVADASHELKTPLTVILTNAQLLHAPDFTETEKRHFSDNILTTAEQMRTLIEGLLDLSRADRGVLQPDATAVNFSDLLTQHICLYEPIYFEHGFHLRQTITPALSVSGNHTQLGQVIDSLLDNADKYGAPHSEICVSLRAQRHHCLLAVTTAGTPLTASEQKAIFQRFYRVDQTRSFCGSYGLGLSIADTLVRAHHGSIWAESDAHSNTFFVRLPLHTNGK